MIAVLVLELYFAMAGPPAAPPPAPASPLEGGGGCIAPANLTPDISIRFEPTVEVPADLPESRFVMTGQIPIDLAESVPSPAPRRSELDLGTALIDAETGAVSIDGAALMPQPTHCP